MMEILQNLVLPDGARVVRYDAPLDSRGLIDNLACFNPSGSLRWRNAPPYNAAGQADFFTFVRLDGKFVVANTYGCWDVWIDPKSGQDIRTEFMM